MHNPTWLHFQTLARDHTMVPVYRRIASDTLTPVLAFHRIDSQLTQGACLFESVVGGEVVGRFSFLAADPYLRITAFGHAVRVQSRGDAEPQTLEAEDPMALIREQLRRVKCAHPAELPPFIGGAVGYAGYDVVRYYEHLPHAPKDDRQLPDLWFAFFDRMIVFDHVKKTITVVVMAHVRPQGDLNAAYRQAADRVDATIAQLVSPSRSLPPAEIEPPTPNDVGLPVTSNFTREQFEAATRRCIEYINAGDVFQVVLSQRFSTPIQCEPFEIYRSLRTINPSPFMFFLRTPETTLVGSSPEILCRVMDREITVRPLAGTRRRGENEQEDADLERELLADPKERAEHVMLVDLGRNDVGRVSQFGSIQLTDVMHVERYSHVMHITSNVRGRLRPELDAFDALRACLPAGTVSGAPKVRTMQIIDELEPHRRGPYAGAVGYFDFSGNMDTCIALRTIVVKQGMAYIQAGAGIVADSVPALEYEETCNKARGLLQAIALTERRHGSAVARPSTHIED